MKNPKSIWARPEFRKLIISSIALVAVAITLFAATSAWYTANSNVAANNIGIGAVGSSIPVLSVWTGDEWNTISAFDMTLMVPNEARRYKVNSDTPVSGIRITIEATTGGDNEHNIFDYLYIKQIIKVNDEYPPLTSQGEAAYIVSSSMSNGVFSMQSTTPMSEIVFDIYLDSSVCNHFSGWGFNGEVMVLN